MPKGADRYSWLVWGPVLSGAGTLLEVDNEWEVEDLLEYADVSAIKGFIEQQGSK